MEKKSVDFKTMSTIVGRSNPSTDGYWGIGLDIGYSAVKGLAPNKYFCYPSYAKKIPHDRKVLKEDSPTDIRYRTKEGELWTVGALAYDEVNSSETIDSESELFGRHRYYSPMFLVIARVGIAIGLMKNPFGEPGDRKLMIQTGLPPKYLKGDTQDLKDALSGHHEFEIKIGSGPWTSFVFDLTPDDIMVMPQPLGALVSASVGLDGRQIPTAKEYFSSNLIVFDPGFGTVDDYTVMKGNVISSETFPEYGMREVFARTCEDIKNKYRVDITIPELQNKLCNGTITYIDRKAFASKEYDFTDILLENSEKVCHEIIEKLKSVHNYFEDINYIIAAGGTYDAWADIFSEVFKNMTNLQIIPGNINEPALSNVFSNVRGYYYYLNNNLRIRGKK